MNPKIPETKTKKTQRMEILKSIKEGKPKTTKAVNSNMN
jgi:hypothetical protein